jgi:hypothetical protein
MKDLLDDIDDLYGDESIVSINDALKKNEQYKNLERYKTALKKVQFINEIKGELGNEIKHNPGGVKFIKKPWYKKLGLFLKKIFTKF